MQIIGNVPQSIWRRTMKQCEMDIAKHQKNVDSCVRHWIQENGKESNRIERLILESEKKESKFFSRCWPYRSIQARDEYWRLCLHHILINFQNVQHLQVNGNDVNGCRFVLLRVHVVNGRKFNKYCLFSHHFGQQSEKKPNPKSHLRMKQVLKSRLVNKEKTRTSKKALVTSFELGLCRKKNIHYVLLLFVATFVLFWSLFMCLCGVRFSLCGAHRDSFTLCLLCHALNTHTHTKAV